MPRATKDAPVKTADKKAAPARKAGAKKKVVLDKFLEGQLAELETERANYLRQAESLQAEADSLTEDREPGDVQFDEESGEGDTLAVERERDLALSAQAPRRRRADRHGDRQDPRRHLWRVREVRHRHPQGAAQGAAVRCAVREVQERGPGPPLTQGAGSSLGASSGPTDGAMTTHDDREHERLGEATDDRAEGRARWPLLLGVAAVVLAVDQLSKAWAVEALGDGDVVDLVGSLRLRLTMNYGSAFSLADGRGPLISLLALVVVAVLLRTGRHATRPSMAVALGLVLGGAFGNLIDRAFRAGDGFLGGGVVDFIDLQWWPVFNVADSAIVVGAILLFLVQWREVEPAESSGRS